MATTSVERGRRAGREGRKWVSGTDTSYQQWSMLPIISNGKCSRASPPPCHNPPSALTVITNGDCPETFQGLLDSSCPCSPPLLLQNRGHILDLGAEVIPGHHLAPCNLHFTRRISILPIEQGGRFHTSQASRAHIVHLNSGALAHGVTRHVQRVVCQIIHALRPLAANTPRPLRKIPLRRRLLLLPPLLVGQPPPLVLQTHNLWSILGVQGPSTLSSRQDSLLRGAELAPRASPGVEGRRSCIIVPTPATVSPPHSARALGPCKIPRDRIPNLTLYLSIYALSSRETPLATNANISLQPF